MIHKSALLMKRILLIVQQPTFTYEYEYTLLKYLLYVLCRFVQYFSITSPFFRSAFRMPTSRSYPGHLVQFCEKRKSILPPLFLLLLFSKKDATFYKSASFLQHSVVCPVIRSVIRPVICPIIRPVICPAIRLVIHPVIRPVIPPVI